MKIKSLTCIIIFFLSCSKNPSTFEIHNLNGDEISILGHRGMGKKHKYPGNSFEAVETVLKIGADGSEIDVQITKDSVLIVFHDKELSKTTDCEGMVRDYDWAEIDSCTYKSPDSQNIYLITAHNLFSRLPNVQNYYFSFDCKFYPNGSDILIDYYRQYIHAVKQVIDNNNMHNKVLIESGSIQFHQMLKESGAQVLQFITGTGIIAGIPIAEELDLYGIGSGSIATGRDIKIAHEKGFRVMTWTPKTKRANIKAIRKNPDFIQTGKPVHMLKILDKYKAVQHLQ